MPDELLPNKETASSSLFIAQLMKATLFESSYWNCGCFRRKILAESWSFLASSLYVANLARDDSKSKLPSVFKLHLLQMYGRSLLVKNLKSEERRPSHEMWNQLSHLSQATQVLPSDSSPQIPQGYSTTVGWGVWVSGGVWVGGDVWIGGGVWVSGGVWVGTLWFTRILENLK